MALVSYSDSEDSDIEQQSTTAPTPASSTKSAGPNFAVDKSNPGKIKVSLQSTRTSASEDTNEDEPAPKRPRIGAGQFSGFNSMLPAPKKANVQPAQNGTSKASSTRKVFSLKTGAEASFSRESDAELRNLFASQDENTSADNIPFIPSAVPKPAFAKPAPPAANGAPLSFKPLSVARNQKKKKTISGLQKATSQPNVPTQSQQISVNAAADPPPPKKKVSLFSNGADEITAATLPDQHDTGIETSLQDSERYPPDSAQDDDFDADYQAEANTVSYNQNPQTLDAIASDLNLTAAQKRQLFGRSGNNNSKSNSSASAVNIVNFNTDEEYAHNQSLIAAGETVQHNPVRAIAPGKHSLRQLVTAASGQKDALEESFAQGRRNKKEAGNKYGW